MVVYPCLNQGKWVSPLIHFQQKLDSIVGGRAQDQQQKKNHLWHLLTKKQKKFIFGGGLPG